MIITRATLLACIVATVCMARVVFAQQTPPAAGAAAAQTDAAAALRSKDVLSEQDKAQLRQWITDRISALEDAAKKTDIKTMATTRRNMSEAAANSGPSPATPGFRIAYAELCSGIFQPYLGIGEDPKGNDPRIALYLAQILGSLKQIGTVDAMLAALNSKYPAVRLCAAKAIRDLRSEIVATRANQVNKIITTIQQAGAKEGDAPTARMLYEAVDFRGPAAGTAGQVAAAILEMLKGHQQFYANDLVSELHADAYAMNLLQGIELPDPEKRKAIPIAYAIIEVAAQRWAPVARQEEGSPVEAENPYDVTSVRNWHLRYQLTYATEEAEALLKKLGAVPAGSQAPDMAGLMKSLSTADQVHMAADKWQALVGPRAPATAASATPAP